MHGYALAECWEGQYLDRMPERMTSAKPAKRHRQTAQPRRLVPSPEDRSGQRPERPRNGNNEERNGKEKEGIETGDLPRHARLHLYWEPYEGHRRLLPRWACGFLSLIHLDWGRYFRVDCH